MCFCFTHNSIWQEFRFNCSCMVAHQPTRGLWRMTNVTPLTNRWSFAIATWLNYKWKYIWLVHLNVVDITFVQSKSFASPFQMCEPTPKNLEFRKCSICCSKLLICSSCCEPRCISSDCHWSEDAQMYKWLRFWNLWHEFWHEIHEEWGLRLNELLMLTRAILENASGTSVLPQTCLMWKNVVQVFIHI